MMIKTPTIHDLASELGISATTVWRALNNHGRISAETRERVLKRAKEMDYLPSLVAQNLARGRTGTLGIIVPTISHPIFSAMIEKIEEVAFDRGYNIIICDAHLDFDREVHYARMLRQRRVEGVIVIPFTRDAPKKNDDHLSNLIKNHVPVVLMEHELPGNHFDSVVAENFAATYQMTRHLIELGHERIALAYHPLHQRDPVARERVAGFSQAMSDAGLKQKASLLLDACDFGERQVLRYRREEIVNCFSQPDRPTGLFAGMDLLAIRAMETLKEMGLRIPQDVAVVGFDNIEFSQWTSPPLTTVHTPTEEMGYRAVEILFDRIESKADHRLKTKYERLPCKLVIRQSCGGSLPLPPKS